jgi:uncharacterized protein
LRASSPPNQAAILIAAVSGRALAESARRGGYAPLVADFFGDQDTLRFAQAHVRLGGELALGIKERNLVSALEKLCERHQPVGIVCGSGFERKPHILQSIAERWRLFGNNADTVANVKNPEMLFSVCADLEIPCPPWSLSKPSAPRDWLAKRQGGAGGAHVGPAHKARGVRRDRYYQQKVPGKPVGVLFLADGKRASVLGFSEQWSSPTPDLPYRYGGAVRPATLAPSTSELVASAVNRLAAALSLVGLNSADFLVEGERFWLLEINPRPGATLDIFEPLGGSLFAMHVAACEGNLTLAPRYPEAARAAAIVYAESDIASVPALDWPDWTADRPAAGTTIKAGQPLCTVYADGPAAPAAKAIAEQRREMVLAWASGRKT